MTRRVSSSYTMDSEKIELDAYLVPFGTELGSVGDTAGPPTVQIAEDTPQSISFDEELVLLKAQVERLEQELAHKTKEHEQEWHQRKAAEQLLKQFESFAWHSSLQSEKGGQGGSGFVSIVERLPRHVKNTASSGGGDQNVDGALTPRASTSSRNTTVRSYSDLPIQAPGATSSTIGSLDASQASTLMALKELVKYTYGVVAAELWVANPKTGLLQRPKGGYHRDPPFQPPRETGAFVALCDFEDPFRVEALAPGLGLAGRLWANPSTPATGPATGEASGGAGLNPLRRGSSLAAGLSFARRQSRSSSVVAAFPAFPGGGGRASGSSAFGLSFRSLQGMNGDPEEPNDERLGLAELVFGSVCAVRMEGGLCLLFTKPTEVDPARLLSQDNAKFILSSVKVLGSLVAWAEPRRAAVGIRDEVVLKAKRKLRVLVKSGLLAKALRNADTMLPPMPGKGVKGEAPVGSFSPRKLPTLGEAKAAVAAYADKCKGTSKRPPPGGALDQCCWTFAGVFVTLLVLSAVSEWVKEITEGGYFVLLGSFGALMTLQFGAHSSPLCQPRNALLGNILSGFVAVCFSYVSPAVLAPWVRAALAPATAISLMNYCGVLHPPAGAAALIFATAPPQLEKIKFMYLVLPLLVGNVIAVFMATLVNNLNAKRQYPLYWF